METLKLPLNRKMKTFPVSSEVGAYTVGAKYAKGTESLYGVDMCTLFRFGRELSLFSGFQVCDEDLGDYLMTQCTVQVQYIL